MVLKCTNVDLLSTYNIPAPASIAAIHKQQLVHRDIKPSNIMVNLEAGKRCNCENNRPWAGEARTRRAANRICDFNSRSFCWDTGVR